MSNIDEKTLSRYLDGELDFEEVNRVADQIENDKPGQEMLLDMLRFQSLMRAMDKEERKRAESAGLEAVQPEKSNMKPKLRLVRNSPLLQVAAALVLLVAGFLYGTHETNEAALSDRVLFPVVPTSLTQTISEVLEYEPSGTVRSWQEPKGNLSAEVRAVKSYRDKSGTVYRLYYVDVEENGNTRKLAGLAYREKKEQWATRSLFRRDDVKKM